MSTTSREKKSPFKSVKKSRSQRGFGGALSFLFGRRLSTGAPPGASNASGVNDPAALSAFGAWGMNIVSSVGLIMANKMVLSVYNFKFATTLTGLHFGVTAGIGLLFTCLGYLPNKHVPFWTLFWFSLTANASIVGMNLSLMLNSVGFYQIAKLSIIPVVCLLEAVLNGKTFSRQVRLSVVIVMLGVAICTVTDVSVNAWGFTASVVAVVATSLQQIFVGSLQKKHNIGSFDLLSKTAPIQAACLLTTGPFFDYLLTGRNVLRYEATPLACAFIAVSCVGALFVNLSTYLCIGKFSAVSFQILGHMKTVAVLLVGWLFFESVLSLKNVAGMAVAVVGMVIYSWAAEAEKPKSKAPPVGGGLAKAGGDFQGGLEAAASGDGGMEDERSGEHASLLGVADLEQGDKVALR
eukprot:jgi/Mesen1/6578/ME000336S05798